MKKLILILLSLLLGNQHLLAQGKQQYEMIYHIGENIGFFPYKKGLNECLFKGIKQKQITAYEYTDKFGEFSKVLSEGDIYNLETFFDTRFQDSASINRSRWDIEVQSKKGKIIALALTFNVEGKAYQPDRRILMKYDECKAYLNTTYQNSLKHQKIDYLEAAWFDYDNHSRQLSLVEALEKGLYKGVEKVNGSYPTVNTDELWKKQKAILKFKGRTPFYMQHTTNEKHTILTRSIDFNVFNYPYQYPFYDSLSLDAQIEMIKKESLDGEQGLKYFYYTHSMYIDSTQNYRLNKEWTDSEDNFFQRIYDGIVFGEIKVYQPNAYLHEENLVPMEVEEFISNLKYEDSISDKIEFFSPAKLKCSFKEYYYIDSEGNPTKSVIDYLTLEIPDKMNEKTLFGDLTVGLLKFSDVKAYFEKIYQKSKGRLGSVQNMCMTTALEKHQHYIGIISKFFNPSDWTIGYLLDNEGENTESAFELMHAVQQELKDKRNLVSDMPSRAKDVVRIFPPILTIFNAKDNTSINTENPISAKSIIKIECGSDPYSTDHDANRKYEITSLEFTSFRDGRAIKSQKFEGVSELNLSTLGLVSGDGVQIKIINVVTLNENGKKVEVKLANPYAGFLIE